MSVLGRYLLREMALAFAGVFFVLALVIGANLLVRALALSAEGGLPASLVPWLLGVNAVKLLGYMLPVALFIGLVFALGRLARDSELGVMRACGVGAWQIYRPVFLLALPVAVLVGWLALDFWPALQESRDDVIAQAQSLAELKRVPTGRFIETPDGQTVAYVARQDGRVFREVFLYTLRDGVPSFEFAGTGELVTDPQTGHRFVELRDGRRYEGVPGRADFRVIGYDTHRAMLPGLEPEDVEDGPGDTLTLLGSDDPRDHRELLKRVSQPLSVLALALLAVPLAHARPRSGRYARLVTAVLVYAVYFNLVGVANSAVGRGELSVVAGALLVPGLTVMAAMAMLWSQGGGLRRLGLAARRSAVSS
ncbi:MAG: LPS export ABC transporter permease LptF [Halothiobacillaceae bacterium]